MLRSRMGFGALAMFIAISAVMASLLPVIQADALTDPGGGSWSVTATFEDSADIAVLASGTDSPNANTNLDMSAVQGIYFNGNTVPDGSQWPITAGSQTKYWFNNNKTSTCQGNNSDIVINNYSPGNVTATFNLYLPETDSVAQTGKCYAVSMTGQPVDDTSAGGNINTFKIGSSTDCGGRACVAAPNDGYTAVTLGADASTTNYFLASSTQIIAAGADPSQSGGGAKYTFNQTTVNGKTVFKQSAGGGVGACPDEITMPTSTGLFIQATYTTWGQTADCNNGAAGTTYQILVLGETPGAYFAGLGGTGSDTGDGGNGSATAAPPDTCPIQNWALRWLVCPILDVIDATVAVINSYLANLLIIPTSWFDTTQNPGQAYFAAWGTFRDIAVSLIVIAALIMVIGESAGFDLLDAYSIRKILPRLLTGAVAMTLSWVICTFIIQLFNNLINWLPDIILSPFQTLYAAGDTLSPTGVLGSIEQAGGQVAAGATMGAGVIIAIGILQVPGILSLLLTLFIAVVIAFITLTIRAMIILLWLIASPIGIACYILPTTQKGFHFWRDTGVAALMVGIVVAVYIAAGQLVAIIAIVGKGFVPIMAPVAIIVSYLGISTAFRQADGLMGKAAGAVHGAHQGILSKQKEYRHGLAKKRGEQAVAGESLKGNLGTKFNPKLQRLALTPKAMGGLGYGERFKKSAVKKRVDTLQGDSHKAHASHLIQEGEYFAPNKNNDIFNRGVMRTIGEGTEVFEEQTGKNWGTGRDAVVASIKYDTFGDADFDFSSIADDTKRNRAIASVNQTADRVMAAKQHYGNSESLLQAAIRANATTGTGWKDTELDFSNAHDRQKAIRYMEDPNHEAGRHYKVVDEIDDEGNAIPLTEKDAAGVEQPVYKKDSRNKILLDPVTNQPIRETKKKIVIHDATGQAYRWINIGAGHDYDNRIDMFAEMRTGFNNSGRVDQGGAGFGDGAGAIMELDDAVHKAEHDTTLSKQEREEAIMNATVVATSKALKSAAEGNDAGMQSGGKPYSSEALAREHYYAVKDLYKKWTDARDRGLDPVVVQKNYRSFVQRAAAAMNVYDSYRARSNLNTSLSADILTGKVVPGGSIAHEGTAGAVGPTAPDAGDATMMQMFEMIQNDPAWNQIRQDIRVSSGGPHAVATPEEEEEAARHGLGGDVTGLPGV